MRIGICATLLAAAAICTSDSARADVAGDKLLAQVDAAANRAKTHAFEYEITHSEPGKAEKKLGMTVRLKGEKRLYEFTAPADMKGTKVLILSPTEMYVYLPAFGKVRRIASHTTDQGFMGLAFSQDDLTFARYAGPYGGQILSDAGATVKVVATPKEGQTAPYPKVELTVTKEKNQIAEAKYFDASGANTKLETRTGYTCQADVCTPGELKMVDLKKSGLSTRMVRKTWKVNEEISDDVFSKRSLEK